MFGINPMTQKGCSQRDEAGYETHPQNGWSMGQSERPHRIHPASEESLLDTLRKEPFRATSHARLGAVYWEQGRTEDALNSLMRALELDPRNKEAIVNSSNVFRALGREDDARQILCAYLEARPDDTEVRSLLNGQLEPENPGVSMSVADFLNEQGESQFGQGRLDRARVCFEMAIEADPAHWSALSNLGVVCWEDGEIPTALDHLLKALDLSPSDPDVLHNCFQVLKAAGHLEVAAEVMRFYLQKGLGDEHAWEEYAQLEREIGASPWVSDGLSDDVARVYVSMGAALIEAGDRSGAITALERALRIDEHNVEAHYHLGCILNASGDVSAALEVLRKVKELNPEHEATLSMLDELAAKQEHSEAGTVAE